MSMGGIRLDRTESPYEYKWPNEKERFDCALHFSAVIEGKEVPLTIALGEREAFGQMRKRVIVSIKKRTILELCGTDDYDATGNLLCVLRKPNSEEMYERAETTPLQYWRFARVYHNSYIKKGGYDRVGILVGSDDFRTMIDLALTRAVLERML
jgi:hypothetical protein